MSNNELITSISPSSFVLFATISKFLLTSLGIKRFFQKPKVPKLKLYYFDIPGRGESLRLFCIYAGLPFEDCRLTQEEFQKLKDNGKLPFGQLPALEADGTIIVQSAAIIRYLSKLTRLHPDCPIKNALIDSIIDQENDMFTGLIVSRYQGMYIKLKLMYIYIYMYHDFLILILILILILNMNSSLRI